MNCSLLPELNRDAFVNVNHQFVAKIYSQKFKVSYRTGSEWWKIVNKIKHTLNTGKPIDSQKFMFPRL